MVEYTLLGQTVQFDDAAERFFDLQSTAIHAGAAAKKKFTEWYKQCGNIQCVLDSYLQFVESALETLAFQPLFAQLAPCEIYDISEESYWNCCIGLEESESALATIEKQYNAILKQQSAEKEYRADRKAGRNRYKSYTRIESDYWLADHLTAGVKNLATFAGHSLVNAGGNAVSALSASRDKNALYKNSATQNALLNGILADLFTAYSAHLGFLNERKENYFRSIFDEDKSNALFDNAKKLPEKRAELLTQAVQLCPWNADLVQYIFVNFPADRETICEMAERFSVDLTACMEEMLAREYTDLARTSEPEAQKARERILQLMQTYHIAESATLDQLETDCLTRLCDGCGEADKAACGQLIAAVRQYPVQEKLKPAFLNKIQARVDTIWTAELTEICQGCETAEEHVCEQMSEKVKQHEARDDLKAPFLAKIQKRIETIWSAEDNEIFDNIYLKTNLSDLGSVAEAIAYIREKGRTDSSKQYLEALEACTPKMIQRARLYKHSKRPTIYLVLAALSLTTTPFITPVGAGLLAIVCLYQWWQLKKAFRVLTVGGKVIHPALAAAPGLKIGQESSDSEQENN